MKKVAVEDALGLPLAHDVTKIVPGSFKGVGFKRGHCICKEDIEPLLDLGKKTIYVMELAPGEIHEDEAGLRLARVFAGANLEIDGPREGKFTLSTLKSGLLKVKAELVTEVNCIQGVTLSTLHNNTPCQAGQAVGATRIIPLTIQESMIRQVEDLCSRRGPALELLTYPQRRIGALVTGSEVFEGRIRDAFDHTVGAIIDSHGQSVWRKLYAPDDADIIARSLKELAQAGCELIVVTAGLSVDPDDATVNGIQRAGAVIHFYGTPIQPGSMFLYGQLRDAVVLGLPACVFHHTTTIFNLVLPRILVGDTLMQEEMAALGHGGYCQNCPQCHFPCCSFGK